MIKNFLITLILSCVAYVGFAQGKLISYEEVNLMLHNNINRNDSLLLAKGYTQKAKNEKKKTREYTFDTNRGTFVNVALRADGRRMFIELETNDNQQFDVLISSIKQYPYKRDDVGDIEVYVLKDLGSIYITSNDNNPNPLKKYHLIQIAPDKNVMAYD